MNAEREMIKRLWEYRDCENEELNEASFEVNGSIYKSSFGRYTKDGERISREEYLRASDAYRNSSGVNSYYGLQKAFNYRKNPAKLVKKMNKDKSRDYKNQIKSTMNHIKSTMNGKGFNLKAVNNFAKVLGTPMKDEFGRTSEPIEDTEGNLLGNTQTYDTKFTPDEFRKHMDSIGAIRDDESGIFELYDKNDNTVTLKLEKDGRVTINSFNYDIHNK